jgi:hypothetical protein
MIDSLSNDSYEEIDQEKEVLSSNIINRKNLNRIVRVRNIVKKKYDPLQDYLGMEDIQKFKDDRRNNDNELIITLKHLGPPAFLKTKFKKRTIEKFKVVRGKYFGVISK